MRVLLNLESTSFRQLMPRIASLLLERAQDDSVDDLTHQEMAQYLRVCCESVTAALGQLRNPGIIGLGRKRIRILNRHRLERASRE